MSTDDDLQTPEELAVLYGPASAYEGAEIWLKAIYEAGDFRLAWRSMAPAYRLCRAQAWLYNNRNHPTFRTVDLDSVAQTFIVDEPHHGEWVHFAESELRLFQSSLSNFSLTRYGAGSRPRPIDLNHTLLIFMDVDGEPTLITQSTLIEGVHLVIMELTESGWQVAQFGSDRLPMPGWPPNLYPEV